MDYPFDGPLKAKLIDMTPYELESFWCLVVAGDDPGQEHDLQEVLTEAQSRYVAAAANAHADLLAACEALPLDREFMDASDYKDNAARFDRAMELARAAIAKAKGGA